MAKLNPYNSKEEVLRFENRLDDLIAYLNKHSSLSQSEMWHTGMLRFKRWLKCSFLYI